MVGDIVWAPYYQQVSKSRIQQVEKNKMRLFNFINYRFGLLSLTLLAACFCGNTFADNAQTESDVGKQLPEPYRMIKDVTNRLLSVINDEKVDPLNDPDDFYILANEILEPVVAFDYIAAGVMGNYAKQTTPEQRVQFTETFKKGLVDTYSKGVAAFSGSLNITILEPETDVVGRRKVSVIQRIVNDGTTTYISYTMAQNRDDQWKLINVILNGVNLGKTFRGQFAQAVEKNQGDVVKVIDNWGKES